MKFISESLFILQYTLKKMTDSKKSRVGSSHRSKKKDIVTIIIAVTLAAAGIAVSILATQNENENEENSSKQDLYKDKKIQSSN